MDEHGEFDIVATIFSYLDEFVLFEPLDGLESVCGIFEFEGGFDDGVKGYGAIQTLANVVHDIQCRQLGEVNRGVSLEYFVIEF